MLRTFKVEKFHAGIVPESTLFKVLRYLDNENIETPFLLIDSEKVKEKAFMIAMFM